MRKSRLAIAAHAAILLVSIPVSAHQEGDIIVRGGFTAVVPNDDSDAINLPTDPATVLPGGVGVDTGYALGLTGVWMITDIWGLELLAATPFEHDIDVKDLNIDAGSTEHLPPTLSLQWYPMGGKPGWQPYLGLGVNYTTFFSESVDSELRDVLGAVLDVNTAKLSLDDSFGLSAQAGVDIPLNDKWMLNFGVWYIDIDTEATIDVTTNAGAAAEVSFDVEIDPWVYNIGIAYKF